MASQRRIYVLVLSLKGSGSWMSLKVVGEEWRVIRASGAVADLLILDSPT